jgi:hypothetical protein
MHAIARDSLREESPCTSPATPDLLNRAHYRGNRPLAAWRAVRRSVQTRAVATALPGLTVRRHWGLRFAAYLGALLFGVAISGALFRIVSAEYRIDPMTGWYIWASGNHACPGRNINLLGS